MLTQQDVALALPATLKSSATQQLTDLINNIASDPIVAEQVRENFISYAHVLKDGRYKTEDYVHAVAYVSYKLMGMSNKEAYYKTFPNRYATMVGEGKSEKDISAYVSSYHKGKLVNAIMEQSLVPIWVVNQDIYQKAINVQADLMVNANSEKVRSDAANSILTHLSKPKEAAIKIDMTVKKDDGMQQLTDTLAEMAKTQRTLIENGIAAKTIAGTPLLQRDVIENESGEEGT